MSAPETSDDEVREPTTFVGFTGDQVEQVMVTSYGDRVHVAFRAHVGAHWSAPIVLLPEPK